MIVRNRWCKKSVRLYVGFQGIKYVNWLAFKDEYTWNEIEASADEYFQNITYKVEYTSWSLYGDSYGHKLWSLYGDSYGHKLCSTHSGFVFILLWEGFYV